MDQALKDAVWRQFGAAMDTLEDAINLCPEHLWTVALWPDNDDARYGQFWYVAYHPVVWLDLFLGGSYEAFTPPAPFVRGVLPEQPYPKEVVLGYLKQCRQKGYEVIQSLTNDTAYRVCVFPWMQPTFLELQLYSLRHVQEHAAELNMVLGQHGVTGQDWVAQAR
ncbi:MAG: hypothetical protein OHK0046_13490 [Anaerolineae bacterium]